MVDLPNEMTLSIGCGPGHEATEIGIDIRFDLRPDVVGDMRGLPFRDECFDSVIASHVLEHVPIWDTELSLREMHRVLKPSGTLQVQVPDMGWIAERITKNRLTPQLIPMIYGAPGMICGASGRIGWNHLMAFDAPLLVGYIRLAGFRETEIVTQVAEVSWWGSEDPRQEGKPIRTDKFQELRVRARKKL